jgi:pimeloyl-ACP methyl ester carboxylesterase
VKLVLDKIQGKGVRFIGTDRPGLGLSDFKKGRSFLDWPDDVIELADALGLDKFAIEGVSGGGPYVAACAYKIPHRLTTCGIIGGIGPADFTREGMMKRNVRSMEWPSWIIKTMLAFKARTMKNLDKSKKDFLKGLDRYPVADQIWLKKPEIIQLVVEQMAETVRQGSKGLYYEFMMYRKPWGFNLNEISPKLKVYLWQGELDVNVPVAMVREMCKSIPNCDGRFFPNDGHFSVVFNHFDDVLATLL